MANKLWEKNFEVNREIERFTVGRDREMDLYLAGYDVLGSMAHITMLESIGLLTKEELDKLLHELKDIYATCEQGAFVIEDGVEDVHSQVELMLTRRLGDMGKKIHSGRSLNDQVLVDLKLYTRSELHAVVEAVKVLFDELIAKSDQYKDVLMPGYTHLQIAMPSSFGLWGRCGGEWYRLREYYYDSRKVGVQKTDSEYVEDLKALCGDIRPSRVIVDPSAASFIEALTRCGFKVEKADNDVVSGIRLTASLLKSGKIKICRGCDDALREFYQYRWDEKAAEDRPLKTNDHCLTGDTLVDTVDGAIPISKLVGKTGNVYCTDGETVQIGHFHNVRMTQENAEIYEINLNNGKTIKATADHPVLTKRGWVAVKDLRSNDVIACIGGNENESRIQPG